MAENPVDIEAGLEVCGKATAGPWWFDSINREEYNDGGYFHVAECDVLGSTGIQHVNDHEGYWNDWRFVIEARTGWPAALHELRADREENGRLRRALEDIITGYDACDRDGLRLEKLIESAEDAETDPETLAANSTLDESQGRLDSSIDVARAALKGTP